MIINIINVLSDKLIIKHRNQSNQLLLIIK